MKDRFNGPPIGLRVTKTDADVLRRLARTMYDGMTVSVSDVARLLLHKGMEAYGITPGRGDPEYRREPLVNFTLDSGNSYNGK